MKLHPPPLLLVIASSLLSLMARADVIYLSEWGSIARVSSTGVRSIFTTNMAPGHSHIPSIYAPCSIHIPQ
jgi:hypothetical protein